jgi:hypothetical protein
MDAAACRARAEECERMANTPGYENQRAVLLEIASKWRQLAREAEAADDFGRRHNGPKPDDDSGGE